MKFIIPKNRVFNLMENLLREEREEYLPQDHPLIKTIKASFGKEPYVYETSYAAPYSMGEDYVDVKIIFSISKISLWRHNVRNEYVGTVYILVEKIILTLNNDVEEFNKLDNIPSWIWEDIQDKLLENISNWNIPIDVDFDIKMKKKY